MKSIVRKLKILAKAVVGKAVLVELDVVCPKERFGSDYGGWDIVTANLDADSIIYSFGIGDDASFDIALIERFGLTIHAFDPTPKSIEWVKRQNLSDLFLMHEYGIASFDGFAAFHPPENPDYMSHTMLDRPATNASPISVPVKRLSTIMNELGHRHIDVLKMDVEGAEYAVIKDLIELGIRPQQILVEFHHRFRGIGAGRTRNAVERLRLTGYQLFSISESNEEFSFIRIT